MHETIVYISKEYNVILCIRKIFDIRYIKVDNGRLPPPTCKHSYLRLFSILTNMTDF